MSGLKNETVGIVGLGTMGGAAAARIRAARVRTLGYDIDKSALDAAAATGVQCRASAAEVAREAELVLLSLPGPAEVLEVTAEIAGAGSSGVVIDLSTIDPGSARAASERLRIAGGHYIDAPVLGRPSACGSWTLVASGPQDVAERWRPLLEKSIARAVIFAGPRVGAGSTLKVLNNLMFGAINGITAEILTACSLAGLDPAFFVQTLIESGAASVSGLFKESGPKVVAGDFSPTFSLLLLHKDNALALKLAGDVGLPLVIGSAVQLLNSMGMAQGLADQDSAALVKVYEQLVGHSLTGGGSEG